MAHAKVVEIETGEHVDGIEFLFDNPGLTISGRVTLSDGTPIVNASVQCRGPEGSTPSTSSAKTNSDGRYTTLDLPAGSYSINVIVFDDVPIGAHQTYWVGSRQNVLAGEAGVDIVTLSPIHDRSHDFVGNWTVTYENDTNPFLLTLMPDGSALKSRRNDRATFHGKWVVVDGHALITWDDGGWRDAIYAGPPAENWAYAPGLDLNLAPSAKGEARQISVTP
jgi:hypothetical protein